MGGTDRVWGRLAGLLRQADRSTVGFQVPSRTTAHSPPASQARCRRSLGQNGVVFEHSEARQLALQRIAALRSQSYEALVSDYLNRSTHDEVVGADGTRYDVEVQAFWDKVRQPGDLRAMVAVDSKRRPFRTLTTEDFILAPDGNFVGE